MIYSDGIKNILSTICDFLLFFLLFERVKSNLNTMDDSKIFLIVDDDLDDIVFFEEAVTESFGSSLCLSAHNGEEALELLETRRARLPDIIFLDLNMPKMDGKTCLKKIKRHEVFQKIPVVIYTTSSSTKNREETRALGAAYFITKPTSYTELKKAVTDAVEALTLGKLGTGGPVKEKSRPKIDFL